MPCAQGVIRIFQISVVGIVERVDYSRLLDVCHSLILSSIKALQFVHEFLAIVITLLFDDVLEEEEVGFEFG